MCGQFCRTWNTSVKLIYNIPRSTHTYIVENLLAKNYLPVKTELMARSINFLSSLSNSPSTEVKMLVNVVLKDKRTVTSKNLEYIKKKSGIESASLSPNDVRNLVPLSEVPENQQWRLSLLPKLLKHRKELEDKLEDTKDIDGLCSP